MITIFKDETTQKKDRPAVTVTETLETSPGDNAVFKHVSTVAKYANYWSGKETTEFEITTGDNGFNVSVDYAVYNDSDERQFMDVDIPREAMFEIHAWLSRELYGEDV